MRRTRQRAEVLRVLQATDGHPTAEGIQAEVRKTLPHVSLATIYRQLAALADEGRVALLAADHGPRRYDGSMTPHHHIVCSRCGLIADVPDLVGEHARAEIERWTGFQVDPQRTSWAGLCSSCRPGLRESATDPGTN